MLVLHAASAAASNCWPHSRLRARPQRLLSPNDSRGWISSGCCYTRHTFRCWAAHALCAQRLPKTAPSKCAILMPCAHRPFSSTTILPERWLSTNSNSPM